MSYHELASALNYCPDTGQLTWKMHQHKARAGSIAGHRDSGGYGRVWFKGNGYAAHRLAWLIATGELPEQIDHKNRVRYDNRFVNLRAADASQNAANRSGRGRHSKGVTVIKTGQFQAQVKHRGRSVYLGLFSTEAAAHAVYMAEAVRLHGEFASTE